jgi:hypothetical protein
LNKKIGLTLASSTIIAITLLSAHLTFAQIPFDYCRVSAYVSEVNVADATLSFNFSGVFYTF